MTVRIEKRDRVWTVIHSRPEARNAMDPESAEALLRAFKSFASEAIEGARRFAGGRGRHGDFSDA